MIDVCVFVYVTVKCVTVTLLYICHFCKFIFARLPWISSFVMSTVPLFIFCSIIIQEVEDKKCKKVQNPNITLITFNTMMSLTAMNRLNNVSDVSIQHGDNFNLIRVAIFSIYTNFRCSNKRKNMTTQTNDTYGLITLLNLCHYCAGDCSTVDNYQQLRIVISQ